MTNPAAMSIPYPISIERSVAVIRPISALQLIPGEKDGSSKLGLLSQLKPGTTLEVCGDGFDERTAKVRCNHAFYFVFRQDIADQR